MIQFVRRWAWSQIEAWDRFWFGADSFAQLRVFRVVFGLVLLGYYGLRTFDLDLLYSDLGVLPLASFRELMDSKYSFSLFFLSADRVWIWIAHAVLLVATFALTLGFWPRLAAFVVYILHLSFDQRNPFVAYGFNKVSVFFLITLMLASYHPRSAPIGSLRSSLSSVGLRLAQIQLCIIYLFAGTEKLKGITWSRGEAMWGVFTNSQLTSFNLSGAAQFPFLLTLLTFTTLIWEIYFPPMVWGRRTRYLWLLGGILLHAGIGITMNIPFFALGMVAAYTVYLSPQHALAIESRFLALVQYSWQALRRLRGERSMSDIGLSDPSSQA
jgi:hypothetical protein